MLSSVTDFSAIASLTKASGDVLRLEILRVLAQDAYGVLELCDIFEVKQSGMSHHLKVLADAGLVAKRREGNSIFYSRALPGGGQALALLQQQLYLAVDQVPMAEGVAKRVAQVKQERATQSQQFFEQNAEKFKAQQDLIAEYPVYGHMVADLLAQTPFPGMNRAVEVGPGEGEFLPELAARFDEVIALDNSAVMLEHATDYCGQRQINNVHFICGDTRYLTSIKPVDCVVMNMVLHHTPSPASIFEDISGVLKPGGALLVAELCHHDQDWAKTACGDVWLGFDPADLAYWAEVAGLQSGHSHYFALRNGFQIQLQQFVKA